MKIKEKIIHMAEWAEDNYMPLIYLAGAWVLLFFTVWSLSLLIGFWSNAIFGAKFELSVGMSGIGQIAAAGATIYGIAKAAQAKYNTDSMYNSPAAEKPKTTKGEKQ